MVSFLMDSQEQWFKQKKYYLLTLGTGHVHTYMYQDWCLCNLSRVATNLVPKVSYRITPNGQ